MTVTRKSRPVLRHKPDWRHFENLWPHPVLCRLKASFGRALNCCAYGVTASFVTVCSQSVRGSANSEADSAREMLLLCAFAQQKT